MIRAIYPGSFDPITYGHIDIIKRACNFVDELYIGVMVNSKKNYLFSHKEREELVRGQFLGYRNIKIISFDGLLVDFMKENNIKAIIKGLRAVTDYNYEMQMAITNKKLYKDVETFFIHSSEEYSFLSSSLIKEIFFNDGDITQYAPRTVIESLKKKNVDFSI